jgi:hypothetical protein
MGIICFSCFTLNRNDTSVRYVAWVTISMEADTPFHTLYFARLVKLSAHLQFGINFEPDRSTFS